jgi:hypothetical protein
MYYPARGDHLTSQLSLATLNPRARTTSERLMMNDYRYSFPATVLAWNKETVVPQAEAILTARADVKATAECIEHGLIVGEQGL